MTIPSLMKMAESSQKMTENTVRKGEIVHISFSHSIFNRLVLQTRKNQGLFGKGLINPLPDDKF